MPSFPVFCQYCRKPLGALNYNLGHFPNACPCPKAQAAEAAREAAWNAPEAKAKRAAEAAKSTRRLAEAEVRNARHAMAEAKVRFDAASNHLVRVAMAQQTPGYDVLRPSTPEA